MQGSRIFAVPQRHESTSEMVSELIRGQMDAGSSKGMGMKKENNRRSCVTKVSRSVRRWIPGAW